MPRPAARPFRPALRSVAVALLLAMVTLAAAPPAAPAAGGARAQADRGAAHATAVAAPPSAATLGHRLSRYFHRGSTIVLLGVLVVCSLLLVLLRQRAVRKASRARSPATDERERTR